MLLTKSKFLIGYQCKKYLDIVLNNPELIPELKEDEKFKFQQGTEIGELAKKLYPSGIDIPTDSFETNLIKSKELLKENKPLFEPAFKIPFQNHKLYSRADILVPNEDGWDIIEVKSSTKVKDVNVLDVAFQKYIYEKEGLKIKDCYLMYVNNNYIRKGELDINQLFTKEDISEQVSKLDIEKIITEVLEESKDIKIGTHCKKPYDCPLYPKCTSYLPPHNVLHLYRIGKKAFELIDNNILDLEEVDTKLTDKQNIQVECAKSKKPHINKEKIKEFLDSLEEPLHYLDFETFSLAIPPYDGTKAYQQIPFQFSLHLGKEHYEFLAEHGKDPRLDFLLALKKNIKDKGSIVVYNQSFEIGRLKELAEYFPEHASWVEDVISRVVDLMIPFRNFWYCDSSQKGSASIKKVLPLFSDLDYGLLDINHGNLASYSYIIKGNDVKVRKSLLSYCELDTLAEVKIVEGLKGVV